MVCCDRYLAEQGPPFDDHSQNGGHLFCLWWQMFEKTAQVLCSEWSGRCQAMLLPLRRMLFTLTFWLLDYFCLCWVNIKVNYLSPDPHFLPQLYFTCFSWLCSGMKPSNFEVHRNCRKCCFISNSNLMNTCRVYVEGSYFSPYLYIVIMLFFSSKT